MAAMEKLVEDGKVRFIGVCNFSVHDLKKAQACLSKHRIVSNQVHFSLVERRIEFGVLDYCWEEHITVVAYSPLECGLQHIRQKDRCEALGEVAAESGRTEAQVALNWCISKKGVIAIPKADAIKHIIENCHASGWRLSRQYVTLLEASIKSPGHIEASLRRAARRVFQRQYRPESLSHV